MIQTIKAKQDEAKEDTTTEEISAVQNKRRWMQHKLNPTWNKPSGEPKTHHQKGCKHCEEGGYKIGCALPFRHLFPKRWLKKHYGN